MTVEWQCSKKIDYENQINKITNAISEIIRGLRTDDKLKSHQPQIDKVETTTTSKSIVVLPFENISNDPDQEYFSDGLTEEIIADLSKFSSLHVISRTSSMVFKGSKKDVRTIGKELNVRYVLEGSVRKSGNKLRITAQLIDAASDAHLWTEKFDGVLDDVFAIQEKVARSIVSSLRLELTPQERARLVEKARVNLAAHEQYLVGRYHLNRPTPSEVTIAIGHFEKAIQEDPTYALAYAGLANAYNYLGWLGGEAKEVFPKAKQAALKALEIDATLAEAHAVLGYAATFYDWDWATAERECELAIAFNPNYAEGYLHYSWYLCSQGRLEEARTAIVKASELDPHSLIIHANMGNYYHFKRDYDGALNQTLRALELAPNLPLALLFCGMAYCGKEQYENAASTFKKLAELAGPGFKGFLGFSYAMAGRKEDALAILNELTVLSKSQPVPSFQVALVVLGLKRFEEALTWMEKAFEERASWFPYIRQECLFDSLRAYPRFHDLVRRLNFPEH
jgi:TolB-like protein/Flp pilus assembly protein TadD